MIPIGPLPAVNTGPFRFGDRKPKNGTVRFSLPRWDVWLKELFPAYVAAPFARRHHELWEWIEGLHPGQQSAAFVAIWPRGGAKSTTAELACVRIGAKRSRRYIWYISRTQDKADKHVETIGSLLESSALEVRDPELSSRKIGKYGHSKGWRRSRLRTGSGLTIDALGLDVGSRGAKIEDQRPDLMIFDDIDEKHDTTATTRKIIDTITTSLLPAGSSDCAILFIQNMIHPNSIVAQLTDGRADFLTDRVISGPYPAIDGLAYEQRDGKFVITGGRASWEGQSLEICQAQINTWGLTAFLQEAQHEVEQKGGIWDHIAFQHCKWSDVSWGQIVRGAVWVDPAVTSTDDSDCMGIQADAIAEDGILYRLYSWEGITSPVDAIKRAIRKALDLKFNSVGVETDQGGDTWFSVYQQACEEIRKEMALEWERYLQTWRKVHPGEPDPMMQFPAFQSDKAGAGYGSKVERNQRMMADYERGKVIHVLGTHETLERSLRRFPNKPLDLADAAFWCWNDLSANSGSLVLF